MTEQAEYDIAEIESNLSFMTAYSTLTILPETTETVKPMPLKAYPPPSANETSTKNISRSYHTSEKRRKFQRQESFCTLNTITSSTYGSSCGGDVSLGEDHDNNIPNDLNDNGSKIVTVDDINDDDTKIATPKVVTVSQEKKNVAPQDKKPSLAELIERQRYHEALISVTRQPLSVTEAAGNLPPLHIALNRRPLPPYSFVKELIRAHPAAVGKKEDVWGFLPLHLACNSRLPKNKNEIMNNDYDYNASNLLSIIEELLRVYPAAIKEKEAFRGMLPIHMAIDGGASQAVVRLLIREYPESLFLVDDFGEYPIDFAKKRKPRDEELEKLLDVSMDKLRQVSPEMPSLIEDDDHDESDLSNHRFSQNRENGFNSRIHQTRNQREHLNKHMTLSQSEADHMLQALCQSKKLQNKLGQHNSCSSITKYQMDYLPQSRQSNMANSLVFNYNNTHQTTNQKKISHKQMASSHSEKNHSLMLSDHKEKPQNKSEHRSRTKNGKNWEKVLTKDQLGYIAQRCESTMQINSEIYNKTYEEGNQRKTINKEMVSPQSENYHRILSPYYSKKPQAKSGSSVISYSTMISTKSEPNHRFMPSSQSKTPKKKSKRHTSSSSVSVCSLSKISTKLRSKISGVVVRIK